MKTGMSFAVGLLLMRFIGRKQDVEARSNASCLGDCIWLVISSLDDLVHHVL